MASQFDSVTARKEKEARTTATKLEEAFPAVGASSPFEPFMHELANVFVNYSARNTTKLLGVEWPVFGKEALAGLRGVENATHNISMVLPELLGAAATANSGSFTQPPLKVLDFAQFLEALSR